MNLMERLRLAMAKKTDAQKPERRFIHLQREITVTETRTFKTIHQHLVPMKKHQSRQLLTDNKESYHSKNIFKSICSANFVCR